MKNLEILAPCGDKESLEIAVKSGADAVYLGLTDFNARLKAENFTKENLRDAIKYCHFFGVKVYLTVNTLIKDNEIDEFIKLIKFALDCKVDAFIIQDFGMALLLKQKFENIVLHASTQMGIHNVDGAKFLEKLGFSRIVLSRETTLQDIKEIKANTNLELEYFVHGALCVCFSGNCYLSSLELSASGNRGLCKQLCRLNYVAKQDDKTLAQGYLLSPKDLCLINNLKLLIDSGITSFKIEGRLKRPAYIATTVQNYKKAILNLNQIDNKTKIEDLKQIFSRGDFNQNAYLYGGKNGNIIEPKYNNHCGIKIGKVVSVDKFKDKLFKVGIKSSYNICKLDGLKFFDENDKEIGSCGVGNVIVEKNIQYVFTTSNVFNADSVNLILNSSLEANYQSVSKKLDVSFVFDAKLNNNAILKAIFKNEKTNRTTEVEIIGPSCEPSDKVSLNFEDLKKQFSKTNNTNFNMINLSVSQLDDIFIPISKLNEMRRNCLLLLEQKIIDDFENNKPINAPKPTIRFNNTFKLSNLETIIVNENNINTQNYKNINVVIYPKTYTVQNVNKIIEIYSDNNFFLFLPVFANESDLKIIDNIISTCNISGVYIQNYYGAKYLSNKKIIVGTGLNVYNSKSVDFWYSLGAEMVVSSLEIPKLENTFEYSGFASLMHFCHCPYQVVTKQNCNKCGYFENLVYQNKDSKQIYKIKRYRVSQCYFEMLNNKKQACKSNFLVKDLREI